MFAHEAIRRVTYPHPDRCECPPSSLPVCVGTGAFQGETFHSHCKRHRQMMWEERPYQGPQTCAELRTGTYTHAFRRWTCCRCGATWDVAVGA